MAIGLLLCCTCLQLFAWLRAKQLVAGTSLVGAWAWSSISLAMWVTVTAVCLAQRLALLDPAGSMRSLAYSSTVFLLAPFVAILGARRPRTGAWNWFVVLPMLLVLHWPVVITATGSGLSGFELPTPMMLGCVLVLTMGLGNSFGTRFTLPAILIAIGMLWVLKVITFDGRGGAGDDALISDALVVAAAAYGLAGLAFLVRNTAGQNCRQPGGDSGSTLDGLNRMWLDFQNLFGIVWAKRVMDRLNQFSARERWPFQVQLHGFEPNPEPPADLATESAMLDRVRWVMRLFVDPEWLDERLGPQTGRDADTELAPRPE